MFSHYIVTQSDFQLERPFIRSYRNCYQTLHHEPYQFFTLTLVLWGVIVCFLLILIMPGILKFEAKWDSWICLNKLLPVIPFRLVLEFLLDIVADVCTWSLSSENLSPLKIHWNLYSVISFKDIICWGSLTRMAEVVHHLILRSSDQTSCGSILRCAHVMALVTSCKMPYYVDDPLKATFLDLSCWTATCQVRLLLVLMKHNPKRVAPWPFFLILRFDCSDGNSNFHYPQTWLPFSDTTQKPLTNPCLSCNYCYPHSQ